MRNRRVRKEMRRLAKAGISVSPEHAKRHLEREERRKQEKECYDD